MAMRTPVRTDVQVVNVDKTLRQRAVDSVTRAFLNDPMWRLVVPDRKARDRLLRPMWRALIDFSRVYGRALTTPDGLGAACWIAPGRTHTTIGQIVRTGFKLPLAMVRVPKDARDRFFRMMRFIDGQHRELVREPH